MVFQGRLITVVKSLYSLTKYNKTFQKLQKKENK